LIRVSWPSRLAVLGLAKGDHVPGNGDFQYGMIAEGAIGLVHGTESPTDQLWEQHFEAMFEAMGRDTFTEIGYFVITAGGAPNTRQRRFGNRAVAGRKMVRSIVTDSFFVRQLVTSWSWFAPGMSAFAPNQMREALLNARVRQIELDRAWEHVREMNSKLTAPVPWVPENL
jgi:hypothetical protein